MVEKVEPTKNVRCYKCNHIYTVKAGDTKATCPNCKNLNVYGYIGLVGGKFL